MRSVLPNLFQKNEYEELYNNNNNNNNNNKTRKCRQKTLHY